MHRFLPQFLSKTSCFVVAQELLRLYISLICMVTNRQSSLIDTQYHCVINLITYRESIGMDTEEAVNLLKACKPLAVRLCAIPPSFTSVKIGLTPNDLTVMVGYARVQADPITAGPGLLNKLFKLADLNQVEVYKLDQVRQLIYNRRFGSKRANTRFKSGSDGEKQAENL